MKKTGYFIILCIVEIMQIANAQQQVSEIEARNVAINTLKTEIETAHGSVNTHGDSLIVYTNSQVQSYRLGEYSNIKRVKFRLAVDTNDIVLKKDQLQLLLSDDQYSTYKHARRCYHASIPMLTLGSGWLISSAILCGIWIYDGSKRHWMRDPITGHDPHLGLYIGTLCVASGIVLTTIGAVLITCGIKHLNKVVITYNNQQKLTFKDELRFSLGMINNGLGFIMNF